MFKFSKVFLCFAKIKLNSRFLQENIILNTLLEISGWNVGDDDFLISTITVIGLLIRCCSLNVTFDFDAPVQAIKVTPIVWIFLAIISVLVLMIVLIGLILRARCSQTSHHKAKFVRAGDTKYIWQKRSFLQLIILYFRVWTAEHPAEGWQGDP